MEQNQRNLSLHLRLFVIERIEIRTYFRGKLGFAKLDNSIDNQAFDVKPCTIVFSYTVLPACDTHKKHSEDFTDSIYTSKLSSIKILIRYKFLCNSVNGHKVQERTSVLF